MADSGKTSYHPLASLAQALSDPYGIAVLEGDDGGQIYVVCPARHIKCSESVLQQLLVDIDGTEWDDPSMRRIYFESRPPSQPVPGGMGGGQVMDQPWIHPRLIENGLSDAILNVLSGKAQRIK